MPVMRKASKPLPGLAGLSLAALGPLGQVVTGPRSRSWLAFGVQPAWGFSWTSRCQLFPAWTALARARSHGACWQAGQQLDKAVTYCYSCV